MEERQRDLVMRKELRVFVVIDGCTVHRDPHFWGGRGVFGEELVSGIRREGPLIRMVMQ